LQWLRPVEDPALGRRRARPAGWNFRNALAAVASPVAYVDQASKQTVLDRLRGWSRPLEISAIGQRRRHRILRTGDRATKLKGRWSPPRPRTTSSAIGCCFPEGRGRNFWTFEYVHLYNG